MLAPGAKIGGFLIGDLLGKGAMGEVYKGEQLSLKRPVAIKRIATHLLENDDMVRRFKREAQVLAKVGHPNVVGVIECEEFPDAAGIKHLLLIMELIEGGRSLKAHLGKPIDWRLATCVVRMCAEGLAAAFEQQVVHRDIKPDNIMMTRKGIAKLVDFGLAKAAESTALTMQAAPMGTPLFMSPEACRGEEIGHAGDLYSLGVTWWYMLIGSYPFEAANLHGLLFKHIGDPLPPPTGLFDHVPPPIVKLVYQCLEKDPTKRPSSAVRLVEAIEALPGQGLLIPRDARELVGAGQASSVGGGGTTAATLVVGNTTDRTAATVVTGVAPSATAATVVGAAAQKTIAGDLSPQGAVAATVVADLSASGSHPDMAATAPTHVPHAPSTGRGRMLAGVVLLVVLLGALGLWFVTRSSSPSATNAPQPAPTTPPTSHVQPAVAVGPTPTPPAAEPVSTQPIPATTPRPAEPPVVVPTPTPVVASPQPDPPPQPVVAAPTPARVPTATAAASAAEPAPAPPQQPVPATPAAIDTTTFDAALADKRWNEASAAAEALPESAKDAAKQRLNQAANAQVIATMGAARKLYVDGKPQDAYAELNTATLAVPYANVDTRNIFIKMARSLRQQLEESP